MKYIVVDTNVIRADWHMRGAAWQTILGSSRELGLEIVLPKVVLDEVRLLFERSYRDCEKKLRATLRSFESVLGGSIEKPNTPSLSDADRMYSRHIRNQMIRYRIRELPYPEVSHQDIVERASRKLPPFSTSDRGYKDFLIWKSMINFISSVSEDVAFVTKNSKDFFVDGRLKPEFVKDLDKAGVDSGRVRCFESLKLLISQIIEPMLKPLEKLNPSVA